MRSTDFAFSLCPPAPLLASSGSGHGAVYDVPGRAQSYCLTRCAGGLGCCKVCCIFHSQTTGEGSENREACHMLSCRWGSCACLLNLLKVCPNYISVDDSLPGCPASLSGLCHDLDLVVIFLHHHDLCHHHLLPLFAVGPGPEPWHFSPSRSALTAWILPTISWCCRQLIAWSTLDWVFYFWPVGILMFSSLQSHQWTLSKVGLVFSCL